MAANSSASQLSDRGSSPWRNRFWRYAPLIVWMTIIFLGSTDALSASNSGFLVKSFLVWLFPHISEQQIAGIQLFIRKTAHFTEYAILALLAARAFSASAIEALRRRWFAAALSLIVLYAFSDEFHQSFVSSRTASVYDSLIDISGGFAALIFFRWRQARARMKLKEQR